MCNTTDHLGILSRPVDKQSLDGTSYLKKPPQPIFCIFENVEKHVNITLAMHIELIKPFEEPMQQTFGSLGNGCLKIWLFVVQCNVGSVARLHICHFCKILKFCSIFVQVWHAQVYLNKCLSTVLRNGQIIYHFGRQKI